MDAFENLEVWKRSSILAINIYHSLQDCRDYGLKDQVIRSAVSISSNIAEGFERNSNRQFAQYLQIAKGSCGELRSQLYICRQIGIFTENQANRFLTEAAEISKMIYGLSKHCRTKES